MKTPGAPKPVYLTPAEHGWNVVRSTDANGTWDVRAVATLDEAAGLLDRKDTVVLALPLHLVLAQRLKLPTVEAPDFAAMVRIQIEKALPYSTDEITSDFEVIERNETESVVSAVAVHTPRLSELVAPLLTRGQIPAQVTLYAAQRAATHAGDGSALLIYREGEKLVSAISENGKISFTRMLDGAGPEQLQADLPQLALTAELQGISSDFRRVFLDEKCLGLRDVVEASMAQLPELVGVETPPANVQLNLLPESWRRQKQQLARRGEWLRRARVIGGIYVALLLCFFAYALTLRFHAGRLRARIQKDAPKVAFVKKTEATWKALAPAIDPHFYPVEVLFRLFQDLPGADVHITSYTQSARQISVDGEAASTNLAYQFADKVKKDPELQSFQFDMGTPRILPNDRSQFRLEGKPR